MTILLNAEGVPGDAQITAFSHGSLGAAADPSSLLDVSTSDGEPFLDAPWMTVANPELHAGAIRRWPPTSDPTTGTKYSWTADPASNVWTAASVVVRSAPALPTLDPVTADTSDVKRVGLSSRVTADGNGGPVTARGFVYCLSCTTPVIGDAVSVNVPSGSGVGPFTAELTGLARGMTYRVRAYATNAQGTRYTDTVTFTTKANTAPTASAGGPYTITEGDGLTLAGSASDADEDPLTYAWDLDGDGQFDDATGAEPTLTSARMAELGLDDGPATRQVRLRVDDGFTTTTATATLTVENAAPTATVADVAVDEGDTATITVTDPADPSAADAATLRYAYDLDDDGTWDIGSTTYANAVPDTSVTLPATLTADGPATHTVRVAVVDKDGDASTTTATVTVDNVAPTLTVTGPETATAGEPVTVRISISDPGRDAVTGTIDWGDGTVEPLEPGERRHMYASPGRYVVTARGRDKDDAEAKPATHTLTVAAAPTPEPPRVTATPAADRPPAVEAPVRIDRLQLSPRCLREPGLRAVIAKRSAFRLRFRLDRAAQVRIDLARWKGKGGQTRCPMAGGKLTARGRKVPGTYVLQSRRTVRGRAGMNTITVAAAGRRRGARLQPGTYLLTLRAGTVERRIKLWVLARR
jgi:hypothetical protein